MAAVEEEEEEGNLHKGWLIKGELCSRRSYCEVRSFRKIKKTWMPSVVMTMVTASLIALMSWLAASFGDTFLSVDVSSMYRFEFWIVLGCMLLCLRVMYGVCAGKAVVEESVMVVQSVGVQLETVYASGAVETDFYEMPTAKGIVINEAITMHRVVFYLALIVLDEVDTANVTVELQPKLKLIPLFLHSNPRLPILREICKWLNNVKFAKPTPKS